MQIYLSSLLLLSRRRARLASYSWHASSESLSLLLKTQLSFSLGMSEPSHHHTRPCCCSNESGNFKGTHGCHLPCGLPLSALRSTGSRSISDPHSWVGCVLIVLHSMPHILFGEMAPRICRFTAFMSRSLSSLAEGQGSVAGGVHAQMEP